MKKSRKPTLAERRLSTLRANYAASLRESRSLSQQIEDIDKIMTAEHALHQARVEYNTHLRARLNLIRNRQTQHRTHLEAQLELAECRVNKAKKLQKPV